MELGEITQVQVLELLRMNILVDSHLLSKVILVVQEFLRPSISILMDKVVRPQKNALKIKDHRKAIQVVYKDHQVTTRVRMKDLMAIQVAPLLEYPAEDLNLRVILVADLRDLLMDSRLVGQDLKVILVEVLRDQAMAYRMTDQALKVTPVVVLKDQEPVY